MSTKYGVPLCAFSLSGAFWWKEALHFNVTEFITFSLYGWCFLYFFKEILPYPNITENFSYHVSLWPRVYWHLGQGTYSLCGAGSYIAGHFSIPGPWVPNAFSTIPVIITIPNTPIHFQMFPGWRYYQLRTSELYFLLKL